MTEKRFKSADEITVNIMDFIDKTFMDCKYYSKPVFAYGYFTLGYCNHPTRCQNNLELSQCTGSNCEDMEVIMNE